MSSSVLWQNRDQSVTVIDVPRSIAAAQGNPEDPCTDVLLSSEPLQDPFPGHSTHDALHEPHQNLLQQAVVEVQALNHPEWCLRRAFVSGVSRNTQRSSKTRTVDGGDNEINATRSRNPDLPRNLFTSITKPSLNPPDFHVQPEDHASDGEYEPGSSLWNTNTKPATMTLTRHDINTGRSTDYKFRLPAHSTFFLADCSEPQAFHEIARERKQDFDFILLDPPWPNRSVKRTHKTPGTSYSTISTMNDTRDLLINLNLSALLSETGHLGIWITNKPAIRNLVINLFEHCGVDLVGEWIWLKTTVSGEPVTPLEGMRNGRKPYEVLLIGKKRASQGVREEEVKRRVLIGVPDLHSRKPCLKDMIEDLVGHEGKVLEVFARYLVSGWWSWGDECIKFNWEEFWQTEAKE